VFFVGAIGVVEEEVVRFEQLLGLMKGFCFNK
jgi:hypothetical protein